jgi:RNA polymerase sigma-70 factor (ECF subfamily)
MIIPENIFQNHFRNLYLSYSRAMVRFAEEFVGSREEAENIVHDAFTDIWEAKPQGLTEKYLTTILFTAIRNRCIDYLRHRIVVRKVEDLMQEAFRREMQMKLDSLEALEPDFLLPENGDPKVQLAQAIEALPEKCRRIFVMSKLEGRKQKDIAAELKISLHTVETQMGIAYRKLKELLKKN